MDKSKLLDKAAGNAEERLLLAKVLDRLEQTLRRNIPTHTGFLSPQELAQARTLLRMAGAGEDTVVELGGYPDAERKLLLFLPDWLEADSADSPIRCLRAAFRAEYGLTHRDILGSLMGMGIVREKIGDLLVSESSCDIMVVESVAEFLLQSWDSAGRAKLAVTAIQPEELQAPEVKCEEARDTVMSLRLDAVAASGFKLARGKAAALVESGKVQVNWTDCTKTDRLLAEGDVVSARGFGKFQVAQVGGATKKGRTIIVLRRYL